MGIEWESVHHLDLRHVGRGSKALQPHAATFHPVQGVIAVAVGTHIIGAFLVFSILCLLCALLWLILILG